VESLTLAYRYGEAWRQQTPEWNSFDIGQVLTGRYARDTLRTALSSDCILSSSDCLHLAYAHKLSRQTGKPLIVDLYDDYESFGLSKLPGLRVRYRNALERASLVICVSQALRRHLAVSRRCEGDLLVVPSTVDKGRFFPMNKHECRVRLGLPAGQPLIGIAGHLSRRRGALTVLEAVKRLRKGGIRASLAAAGVASRDFIKRVADDAHLTGPLKHDEMNLFYNAVDVNVVHVTDDAFGRFSFPQKLYEVLATDSPIAASRIGAVGDVLGAHPSLLYDPADVEDIARVLGSQLERQEIADVPVPDWADVLDPVATWLARA
jgi:glycosyltransferase involved in cell wall biosynthesis